MGGFFDSYVEQEGNGLSFVGENEFDELVKDQTQVVITRVSGPSPSKYGPRYIVVFDLEGEERAKSFRAGSVDSRDVMLDAMQEYLQAEDSEAPVVFFEKGESKSGNKPILIRDASQLGA